MIYLFVVFFLQQVTVVTGVETLAQAIAGFVASLILSMVKSKVNEDGARRLKGPLAFAVTLAIAFVISLAALWYQGGLNTWTDFFKSLGVVTGSMVTTYHLLIEAFGLIEKDKKG